MFTYNFESGWKYHDSNDSKVGWHQQWQDTLLLRGLRMDPRTISNGVVKHDFPIPRLSDKSPHYKIVLLRNFQQLGRCMPCIVTSEMDETTQVAYIFCDLFEVDKTMEVQPVRRASFQYVTRHVYEFFSVNSMFPLELKAFKKYSKKILMVDSNVEFEF